MLRPPRRSANHRHQLQARGVVPRLLVLQAAPHAEEAEPRRLPLLDPPHEHDNTVRIARYGFSRSRMRLSPAAAGSFSFETSERDFRSNVTRVCSVHAAAPAARAFA